jgi:hypothetical protein
MDAHSAPDYDERWARICPTHERMLRRFLDRCAPDGRILDAACGTGKYWPLILGSGRSVLGIDGAQASLGCRQ